MAQHIKNFITQLFPKNDNWKWQLLYEWPKIIGKLYDKVTIEKIGTDHMVIGVTHATWLQELYLLSPVLRAKINKTLDEPRIKTIRFIAVGIKKSTKEHTHLVPEPAPHNYYLTQQEEGALCIIENNELKDALKKYRLRCMHDQRKR